MAESNSFISSRIRALIASSFILATFGLHSAVQEDHSANVGQSRVLSQPLSINPVRSVSFALLDVAYGVPRHPLRFSQFHGLRKLAQKRCYGCLRHFLIRLIARLLALLGLCVRETGVVHWGDVAQVPHDIHHLVVT